MILVKRFGDMATAMILKVCELMDIVDFKVNAEADIEARLKFFGCQVLTKLSVLEKLDLLAKSFFLIFVIEHRELTRGDEYIELSFLLGMELDTDKVYLLVDREIEVSTTLKGVQR